MLQQLKHVSLNKGFWKRPVSAYLRGNIRSSLGILLKSKSALPDRTNIVFYHLVWLRWTWWSRGAFQFPKLKKQVYWYLLQYSCALTLIFSLNSFPSNQRNRQLPRPPRLPWCVSFLHHSQGTLNMTVTQREHHFDMCPFGRQVQRKPHRKAKQHHVCKSLYKGFTSKKNSERQAADLSCFGLHGAW